MIVGGRPKIYFMPLNRRLLGVFYYEGKEYDFNFSKLQLKVKTDFFLPAISLIVGNKRRR